MTSSAQLAKELRYGVDAAPGGLATLLLLLQYLAKFMEMLVFPLVLARVGGLGSEGAVTLIALTLLMQGVMTFFLSWKRTGGGYFLACGPTISYYVAAFYAVRDGGLSLLSGMMVVGGVVQLAITPLIRRLGHIFTPSLAGYLMITIGFWLGQLGVMELLVPGDLGQVMLHGGVMAAPSKGLELGSMTVGLVTLLIMCCVSFWSPRVLRPYALLIGIVCGTVGAGLFGWMPVTSEYWAEMPWFKVPRLGGWGLSFEWRLVPAFCLSAVVSVIHLFGKITSLEFNNGRHDREYDFVPVRKSNVVLSLGHCLSGLVGAPPQGVEGGAIAIQHSTGVYARRLAYPLSVVLLVLAFCPRVVWTFALLHAGINGALLIYLGAHAVIVGLRMVDFPGLSGALANAVGLALLVQAITPAIPGMYQFWSSVGLSASDPSFLWGLLVYFVSLPYFYGVYMLRARRA